MDWFVERCHCAQPNLTVRDLKARDLKARDLTVRALDNAATRATILTSARQVEVGKASELVALDHRRFEVAAREIKSVLPEAVIMDGAIVSGSLEAYVAR